MAIAARAEQAAVRVPIVIKGADFTGLQALGIDEFDLLAGGERQRDAATGPYQVALGTSGSGLSPGERTRGGDTNSGAVITYSVSSKSSCTP